MRYLFKLFVVPISGTVMGWESRARLIAGFIEGFALTWNPFTMALSVAVSFFEARVTGFETTPLRNVLYLLGALIGTLYSYYADGIWFMEWSEIRWMPFGLIVASLVGIPVSWYLRRREPQRNTLNGAKPGGV